MRTYTLILLFYVLPFALVAQDGWQYISQPGPYTLIADESISYTYTNEGVGSHGSRYNLYKSEDGGITYTLVASKTGEFGCYSIDELHVLDANTVFFAENCQGITTIYKSIDGGETWINTGMGGSFSMAMHFLREDFGYYSFYPGSPNSSYLMRNGNLALETTDYVFANGYPVPEQRTEIYFRNDSSGLIMCRSYAGSAAIIQSHNYGEDWLIRLSTSNAYFNDMCFINDTVGFFVGNNGIIRKTTDFGDNWQIKETPTTADLYSINFADDGIGYAAGDQGTILKTTDEGESWSEVIFPHQHNLLYIRAFNYNNVFAVDEAGNLYQHAGSSSIVDPEQLSVKAYPNPVKNKLNLALEKGEILKEVIIFDLQGKKIVSSTESSIDLGQVRAGVYILSMETNNGIITKQIIKE